MLQAIVHPALCPNGCWTEKDGHGGTYCYCPDGSPRAALRGATSSPLTIVAGLAAIAGVVTTVVLLKRSGRLGSSLPGPKCIRRKRYTHECLEWDDGKTYSGRW